MDRQLTVLAVAGSLLGALAACDPAPTPTAKVAAPDARLAAEACLAATDRTTGAGPSSLLRTEAAGAGTAVYVSVPGAEAPWRCLVSPDGTVGAVMYTGSEGYL